MYEMLHIIVLQLLNGVKFTVCVGVHDVPKQKERDLPFIKHFSNISAQ